MQEQTPRATTSLHPQRQRRISVFDGQDLKKAMMGGAAWLAEHRDAINALNVFPVPDGDTGSNMSATMQAAIRAIEASTETSAGVVAAMKGYKTDGGKDLGDAIVGKIKDAVGKVKF